MMQRILIFILVVFALSSEVSAWGNWTYSAAAVRLCGEYGCGCEQSAKEGAAAPDQRFRDEPTHHCYKPIYDLTQYPAGLWDAPALMECPALDKTAIWLEEAENDTSCERWYDLGVGLHYFLDSKEIWNTVAAANVSCMLEQEGEIDEYLRFGGLTWKSCTCGVCVLSDDFAGWLLEYRERVKSLVSAETGTSPSAVILSNEMDRPAAVRLAEYLSSQNVTATLSDAAGFSGMKNRPFIVVAGGQNAPDVGPLSGSVFTDEDKNQVLRSVLTGSVFKKTDVWVAGQTVYFIAGWGFNETADALWSSRETIRDEASLRVAPAEGGLIAECLHNADCGSAYWGPYVCSTKKTSARVMYSPLCARGRCIQRSGTPSTRGCGEGSCLPFIGCVSQSQLGVFEGVRTPMFYSWLSADRGTSIVGKSVKLVLSVKTYLNETMNCQYYGDGWEGMGELALNRSLNHTIELLINVSSNQIGSRTFLQRIRCGNESTDNSGEFNMLYYAEHNFTLMSIAPPLAFTFSVHPGNVSFAGCFDRANVTLRVENLCSHNITCRYSVGGMRGQLDILPVGKTYNLTGGYWTWGHVNETTYDYLDYYSGADFRNGTYVTYDENETPITLNYSQAEIDRYANEPYNITIRLPYFYKNVSDNSTYQWDYPHWSENRFTVDSRECTVDRIPVTVTCTDRYNQTSTLKKDIPLKLPR
ncbi:MAG: hypothetical protein V1875_10345 [Candidatus Altiarchaeota archaeon]